MRRRPSMPALCQVRYQRRMCKFQAQAAEKGDQARSLQEARWKRCLVASLFRFLLILLKIAQFVLSTPLASSTSTRPHWLLRPIHLYPQTAMASIPQNPMILPHTRIHTISHRCLITISPLWAKETRLPIITLNRSVTTPSFLFSLVIPLSTFHHRMSSLNRFTVPFNCYFDSSSTR